MKLKNTRNQDQNQDPLEFLPEILLPWFRKHARDLPWRHTQDPYCIWISEIMLQQTRVAAVLDYYARFLATFPSVEALAAAPESQLMKLWEGLGYYSRARNLQKAAKFIVEQGKFPEDYKGLMALPGIGDYTASAIASAAFGQREAAVDGNVLRAVSRLTDCSSNIAEPAVKKAVRAALQNIMPEKAEDIRIFNQAVMELGAMICVPNGPPKCESCPMLNHCLGYLRGTTEHLPVKIIKKSRRIENRVVFLLVREDQSGMKIALQKRPDTGLLAGLWEFPNLILELEVCARNDAFIRNTLSDWDLELITPLDINSVGQKALMFQYLPTKHIFSHIEWHMTGCLLEVSREGPPDFFWADLQTLDSLAIPSAFARFLKIVREFLLSCPQSFGPLAWNDR